MRVNVDISLRFDSATITKEEAQRRVEKYIERMLDDHSGILTDGGAVLEDMQFDVQVVP